MKVKKLREETTHATLLTFCNDENLNQKNQQILVHQKQWVNKTVITGTMRVASTIICIQSSKLL